MGIEMFAIPTFQRVPVRVLEKMEARHGLKPAEKSSRFSSSRGNPAASKDAGWRESNCALIRQAEDISDDVVEFDSAWSRNHVLSIW
jgi:hypothetical protein